ncbi:MAG TPA: hypothetical protein ENK24_05645 [Anaerolineae bacterium]|nr:hypothetical protein [Anaerolineae bacterium]
MGSNQEIARMVGLIMAFGFTFVLSAGLYAALYATGKLLEKPWLVKFSYLFALAEALSAVGMIYSGYLDRFWVVLVLASAIAYLFIPQGMWWVVTHLHLEENQLVEHPH